MSELRVCKDISFCRMKIYYKTRRSDDHDLRKRIKALARACRGLRFGQLTREMMRCSSNGSVPHPLLPLPTLDKAWVQCQRKSLFYLYIVDESQERKSRHRYFSVC